MTETQAGNLAAAILNTGPSAPKPSARARADRHAARPDRAEPSPRQTEAGPDAQSAQAAESGRRDQDRPAEESFEQAMRRAERPEAQAGKESTPGQDVQEASEPGDPNPDQTEAMDAASAPVAEQVAEILGLADVVKPKQTAGGLTLTPAQPEQTPATVIQKPTQAQADRAGTPALEAGQIAPAATGQDLPAAATVQTAAQGQTAAQSAQGQSVPEPEPATGAGAVRDGLAGTTPVTAAETQAAASVDGPGQGGQRNQQTPASGTSDTTGPETAAVPTSAGSGRQAENSDTGQHADQGPSHRHHQAQAAAALRSDPDATPGMLESSVRAPGQADPAVAGGEAIFTDGADPAGAQPGRSFPADLQQTDPAAEINVQSLQPGHAEESAPTAGATAGSAPAAGTQAASDQAQGEIERPVAAQLSHYLRARNARAGDELVLRLTPPELGSVRMTLRNQDGELRLLLEAANPRTLTQMQREAPALMQRLQDSGIEVRRMEFAQSDGQPEPDASDASGQQSQARQQEMFGQGQDSGRRRGGSGQGRARRDAGYVAETASAADRAPGRAGPDGPVGDETINLWM